MRNSRALRRGILTILTLLWMIMIFSMSANDREESSRQSQEVINIICSFVVEDYSEMPPDQKKKFQEMLSFPIRKGAHMTEYTILGALLSLTAFEYYIQSPLLSNDQKNRQAAVSLKNTGGGGSADQKIKAAEGTVENTGGGEITETQRSVPSASDLSREFLVRTRMAFPTAVIIGFLYACSDEYHQLSVPGRSGEIRDVLIDTTGVLIGSIIITFVFTMYLHRKK